MVVPLGSFTTSGTAVLSSVNGVAVAESLNVMESGALTACSTIVTLAVFAGTSKGTVWPTVKVPRCCCWAAGAALVPIGLSAAVQVAGVPASATRHVPPGPAVSPDGQRVALGGEFVLPLHASSRAAAAERTTR